MSQVSKYPISAKVADRIFEIFIKAVIEIKNKEEAMQFIADFLTPTEKIVLSKRIAIAFLLEQAYDFRTIQQLIKVSAPTVSSVNTARMYGSLGYRKIIARIRSDEKTKKIFEDALLTMLSLPASSGKGSGVWRYLKEEVKKKSRKTSF